MERKTTALLVVGILVVAAVAIGVGYKLYNNDDDEATTYWFYIDYGKKVDDNHVNGWVSTTGTSTADAAKKIPGVNTSENETYVISLDGINDVDNDYSSHVYWAQYNFIGDKESSTFDSGWKLADTGLGKSEATCMYLGYVICDEEWTITAPTDTGWIGTGPLEA